MADLAPQLTAEAAALNALVATCEHDLHTTALGCPYCRRDTRQRDLLRDAARLIDSITAVLDKVGIPDPPKPLLQRLEDEMADYEMVLEHAAVVFDHVTGGRISKPNTLASVVCSVADDHYSELAREEDADLRADVGSVDATHAFVMRVLRVLAKYDQHDAVWWRTDREYAPVTFIVGCNDFFYWGSADGERLTADNVDVFEQAFSDCKALGHACFGPLLFCARVRRMRPQGCCYPKERELWPLFDACGPKREVDLGNPDRHPEDDGDGFA